MFWAIFIRINKRMWHLVITTGVFSPEIVFHACPYHLPPSLGVISPTETRKKLGAQALWGHLQSILYSE